MKKINISKNERAEVKRQNLSVSQAGSGLFLFKNKNQEATLQLPKQSFDNKKWVGPNETWKGDSFFLKMIPKEAILVKTIISPDEQKRQEQQKEEGKMLNENKLILDQPDQITTEGKIEHSIPSEECIEINENKSKKKKTKSESKSNKEKLLTEDPIAGVTIIRD